MLRFPLFTLVALVLLPPPAHAQRSNTRGLALEGTLYGAGLSVNDNDAEGGGGLGLRLGYGFSPRFTLYVAAGGAALQSEDRLFSFVTGQDEYGLGYFDLGAEFNFRSPRAALVPFVNVALSGVAVVIEVPGDDVTVSGGGLTVGGGVEYFVSPTLALTTGLHLTGGAFTTAERDGDTMDLDDTEFGAARLHAGLSWHPSR